MFVGMVIGIIWRTKVRNTTNEVPNCRSPERSLGHCTVIGMRLLTSARRAKMPKYVALKAKMHVNIGSSLLLVQKTITQKKHKWHCLRLHHVMHAITSSDGGIRRRQVRHGAPKAQSRSRRTFDENPTSVMYVGIWVAGYGMVFGNISRIKGGSATNEVPKCRSQ